MKSRSKNGISVLRLFAYGFVLGAAFMASPALGLALAVIAALATILIK